MRCPQVLAFHLSLSAVLFFTMIAYWPGLEGYMLLDDHVNLWPLLRSKPHDFSALLQFVFSGETGPTGRPLALLSFAINYYFSGADKIWWFKFTGLLIHLGNGILIIIFIRTLLQINGQAQTSSKWIALGTGSLWLIHPLNVSTTLYVIQRMTSLSTTFMLMGLLCYLHARQNPWLSKKTGLWLIGVFISLLLAVFSKESGILLLSYIGALEFCLLARSRPLQPIFSTIIYLAALLPVFIVLTYANFEAEYANINGEFTALQRLYSQGPVLRSYLQQIFTPSLQQMGLFHDEAIIAKSLFQSFSVGLTWLGLILLLFFAFLVRSWAPIISLSILWFFSGHILESTVLPLEFYYEHRNYMASVGPLLGVCYYLLNPDNSTALLRYTAFGGFLLLLTWLTWQNTILWSDNTMLVRYWAQHRPYSYRAQVVLAGNLLHSGDIASAQQAILKARALRPDYINTYISEALILCSNRHLGRQTEFTTILDAVENTKPAPEFIILLEQLTEEVVTGRCRWLDRTTMLAFLQRIKSNQNITNVNQRAFVWEAEAMLHATTEPPEPQRIEESLAHAIEIAPNLRTLLWYAKIAAAQEKFNVAKDRLDKAKAYLEGRAWVEQLDRRKVVELQRNIDLWQNQFGETPVEATKP